MSRSKASSNKNSVWDLLHEIERTEKKAREERTRQEKHNLFKQHKKGVSTKEMHRNRDSQLKNIQQKAGTDALYNAMNKDARDRGSYFPGLNPRQTGRKRSPAPLNRSSFGKRIIKGRKRNLYFGSRGGVYYVSKGRKVYLPK